MSKQQLIKIEVGKDPEVISLEKIELKEMQEIVGGFLECIHLGKGVDLWFNEEGRLINLPPNRLFRGATGHLYDILGNAFICGMNEDGDTIGLTDEQVISWLAFAFNAPKFTIS